MGGGGGGAEPEGVPSGHLNPPRTFLFIATHVFSRGRDYFCYYRNIPDGVGSELGCGVRHFNGNGQRAETNGWVTHDSCGGIAGTIKECRTKVLFATGSYGGSPRATRGEPTVEMVTVVGTGGSAPMFPRRQAWLKCCAIRARKK